MASQNGRATRAATESETKMREGGPTPSEHLSLLVTVRRSDLGLSQEELAARMDTSPSTVERMEAGEDPPSAMALGRVAAALQPQAAAEAQRGSGPLPAGIRERTQAAKAGLIDLAGQGNRGGLAAVTVAALLLSATVVGAFIGGTEPTAGRPSPAGTGADAGPAATIAAAVDEDLEKTGSARAGPESGGSAGEATDAEGGGDVGGGSGGSQGPSLGARGGSPGINVNGSPGTSPGGSPGATPGGPSGNSPGGSPGTSPGGSPGTTPGGNPGGSSGGSGGLGNALQGVGNVVRGLGR